MSDLPRKMFLAETAAVREHLAEQEQQATAKAEAALAPLKAKARELEARRLATHRAAVLREAADGFDRHAAHLLDGIGELVVFVAKARQDQAAVWGEAAETLRRMADETATEQCECGCGQPGELVHGRRLAIPEPAAGARQDGAET